MRTNFDECKLRIPDAYVGKKVEKKLNSLGYISYDNDTFTSDEYPQVLINEEKECLNCDLGVYEISPFEEITVEDILGHKSDCALNNGPALQKGCSCSLPVNKVGTFSWAVEQMKQGKKVKRKHWNNNYWYDKNDQIHDKFNVTISPCISNMLATDWEIYEEPKKTLFDKSFSNLDENEYNTAIELEYVKEALKGYFEEASRTHCDKHEELRIKWFGKELV